MKSNINFIIPYFGEFPNYMQLYLNSCRENPNFHWTIITDNTKSYQYPDNVTVVKKQFDELKKKIENKFDFSIVLENPYKFCDMRPMYGYLFPELNKDYEFWGYCDIDVIYGNLSEFITEETLAYDKIFTLGHMTIIKNTYEMNHLFMKEINGKKYYKEVLSSKEAFNFDEDFLNRLNINTICREQGIRIWTEARIADIYTKSSDFRRVWENEVETKSRNYYLWNNGKLVRRIKKNGKWKSEEFMYLHLQKRKMKVSVKGSEKLYKIIPNEFAELEIMENEIGHKDDIVKTKNMNLHYFRIRYKNLITKLKKYTLFCE